MALARSEMDADETTDWAAWGREAVRLMQARNDAWQQRFSLTSNRFRWDIATATLRFEREHDEVIATICLVGTTSLAKGTFLWAWANESVPEVARRGLDRVRAFGEQHGLSLLTRPEFPGARPEGLEMVAVAGRVLDAEGVWIDPGSDVMCYFTLSDFRTVPKEDRSG